MRPAVGVECVECRERKGHRCQAQIFVDGDDAGPIAKPRPLCLPCADGDPCTVDRVGTPRAPEDVAMFEVEIPPARVIQRKPEELGLAATVPGDAEPRDRVDAAAKDAQWRRERAAANQMIRDVEARRRRMASGKPAEPPRKVVVGVEVVEMSPHAVMGAEIIQPEARSMDAEKKSWNRKKLSAEKEQIVRELIREGHYRREICRRSGVSDSAVNRIAKEAGLLIARVRRGSGRSRRDARVAAPAKQRVVLEQKLELAIAEPVRIRAGVDIGLEEARALLAKLTPAQVQTAINAVFADLIRGL